MVKVEKTNFHTDYFVQQNKTPDLDSTLIAQNIPHRFTEYWVSRDFVDSFEKWWHKARLFLDERLKHTVKSWGEPDRVERYL